MAFAHGVVSVVVDKQIAFEGRLLVGDNHARREAAMCSLDISIAVVDANDNRVVVHIVHTLSFLPQCGCKNRLFVYGAVRRMPVLYAAVR